MEKSEKQRLWFDKKYKEGYSREETIEAYRSCVELNKTRKNKSREKTITITNGVVAKRYNADLPIPEGWTRGMLPRKKGCKIE